MPIAAFLLASETERIRDANPAACRLYGRPRGELTRLSWTQLASHQPGSADARPAGPTTELVIHRLADGALRPMVVHRRPWRLGREPGWLVLVHQAAGGAGAADFPAGSPGRFADEAGFGEQVWSLLADGLGQAYSQASPLKPEVERFSSGLDRFWEDSPGELDAGPGGFGEAGLLAERASGPSLLPDAPRHGRPVLREDRAAQPGGGVWAGREVRLPPASDLGAASPATEMGPESTAWQEGQEAAWLWPAVLEDPGSPLLVTDGDGVITAWGGGVGRLLGYPADQVVGRKLDALFPANQRRQIAQVYRRLQGLTESLRLELPGRTLDNRVRQLALSFSRLRQGQLILVHLTTCTPSSRKPPPPCPDSPEEEAENRHAQKMEALGTLAGSIAHDFNNLLGSMIGFTEMAQDDVRHDDPSGALENLAEVLAAGRRARDLINQILTFSRRSKQKKVLVPLRRVVQETMKFLRASSPSTIEFRQRLGASDRLVLGDPGQLQQLVMNLGANAVHAMQLGGGELTLTLEPVTLPQTSAAEALEAEAREYLLLTIMDTGSGIPPELLDKIFDPFFSTKKRGEGTGLGLSVAHGIAKSHGGSIKVHSTPGAGTIFEVYLPVFGHGELPEPAERTEIPKGEGRILLVDDDAQLLAACQAMLSSLGYQVRAVNDSAEALRAFWRKGQEFDLVLADQTMPHITGLELAEEILGLDPTFPVVLMTGYPDQAFYDRAARLGVEECVVKPLERADLAQVVRRALTASETRRQPGLSTRE
ncbi:MAG: response regulator [Deltaproteobacteria bacterium]|nr:response regulator [Deltaproteobacteria bacterium]